MLETGDKDAKIHDLMDSHHFPWIDARYWREEKAVLNPDLAKAAREYIARVRPLVIFAVGDAGAITNTNFAPQLGRDSGKSSNRTRRQETRAYITGLRTSLHQMTIIGL